MRVGLRVISRCAPYALAFLALGAAAQAQSAPPGMIPYGHAVYRHGKRVLWHGARYGEKSEAAPASPTKVDERRARVAKAAASNDFVVYADADDACALHMENDVVSTLKAAGVRARAASNGRVSPEALAKLADGDSVDFAIAPVDALIDDAKASWKDKTPYVTRLADETIEIVADKSINAITDLNGRRVSVGLPESASETVAKALFARLGVKPMLVGDSLSDGLGDLAHASAVAVVAVGGGKALADFGAGGRFHILPLPMSPALGAVYAPVALTSGERPQLIAAGATVDTLASPMALIAVDAAPHSDRETRDSAFVDALFGKFAMLTGAGADPSWRDVNLAASLDWPRLPAAAHWLEARRVAADPALDAFRARAQAAAADGANATDAEKLFQSLTEARGATP
ncbi:MAG: hypothetical protein ACLPN5_02030 [Roseiarcus sp.]